jgi:hypothetical protein
VRSALVPHPDNPTAATINARRNSEERPADMWRNLAPAPDDIGSTRPVRPRGPRSRHTNACPSQGLLSRWNSRASSANGPPHRRTKVAASAAPRSREWRTVMHAALPVRESNAGSETRRLCAHRDDHSPVKRNASPTAHTTAGCIRDLGAAMSQTPPVRTATDPLDPARRPASPATRAVIHPLPTIASRSLPAKAGRTRLCILCGHPLRAGQSMLRIHGSTIHARCTNPGHAAHPTAAPHSP